MKKFIFYSLTSFLFLTCRCNKDELADCGCGKGSAVIFTIEYSQGQTGYLYKSTVTGNPNVPDHKFGVWFADYGCTNCVHRFFICNNSFLTDLGEIPPYPGVEVKFSGNAKNLCMTPTGPADYTYNYLVLTQIELQ